MGAAASKAAAPVRTIGTARVAEFARWVYETNIRHAPQFDAHL